MGQIAPNAVSLRLPRSVFHHVTSDEHANIKFVLGVEL